MTLNSIAELLIYLAAGVYSAYSAFSILDIGLTAFTGTALLVCFAMSALSLFRLLTRDNK